VSSIKLPLVPRVGRSADPKYIGCHDASTILGVRGNYDTQIARLQTDHGLKPAAVFEKGGKYYPLFLRSDVEKRAAALGAAAREVAFTPAQLLAGRVPTTPTPVPPAPPGAHMSFLPEDVKPRQEPAADPQSSAELERLADEVSQLKAKMQAYEGLPDLVLELGGKIETMNEGMRVLLLQLQELIQREKADA
jgi:hypothetical protein